MSLTENGNTALRVELPPDTHLQAPSSGVTFLTDVRPYALIITTESAVSVYLKAAVCKVDTKVEELPTRKNVKWWRKVDLEFVRFAFNETEHGIRFNSYSNNGKFKKKVFQNVSPHPPLFSFPLNVQAEILAAVEALRVKFGVPEVDQVDEGFLTRSTLFDYLVKLAYPAKQIPEIDYLQVPKEFAVSSAWRQALRERTAEGFLQSLLGKRKVTPRMVEALLDKKVEPANLVQAWSFAQRDSVSVIETILLGEDTRFASLFTSGSSESQVFARICSDSYLSHMVSTKRSTLYYGSEIVRQNLSLYKKVPKRSVNSYEELSEILDRVKQEYALPESLEESFQDTSLLLEERGYIVEVDWEPKRQAFPRNNKLVLNATAHDTEHTTGQLVFYPKGKAWTATISARAIRSHNGVDTVAEAYSINVSLGEKTNDDLLGKSYKKTAYVRDHVYTRYLSTLPLVKRQALGNDSSNLLLPPRHAALAFLLTVDDVREQLARVRRNVSQELLHQTYGYVSQSKYPNSVRLYRKIARMVSLGFSLEVGFLMLRYRVPESEFLAARELPEDLLDQLYRPSAESGLSSFF